MILPERNIGPAIRQSDGRPRHRGLIIFLAILILISAGYATWWYLLVEQTRGHLDAWVEDVRTAGHKISYDEIQFVGFPSRITLEIENLSFIHVNDNWQIIVPRAQVYGTPWKLDRVEGDVDMPVEVSHASSGQTITYTISSQQNAFDVDLNGSGAISLKLDGLRVESPALSDPISMDTLSGTLRGGDENLFFQTSINASGISLPESDISPFGEKIESFGTDIDVVVHPTRAASLSEQLDIWRRNGGAIEVQRLSIRHGVLGLDGDGTITLDRDLQPEGAFGASVSGFNPAIDAMVVQGLVPEAESRFIKAALGLLATVPPGGGPKRIDVPLTVQNRELTVGPFPLMRVPRVDWE